MPPDERPRGRCLCGGVRFELSAVPRRAGYCHCTRCQRRTGTAASAQAVIADETVVILAGEELVTGWIPPSGMEKCFCGACGAHLFSRDPATGAFVSVRMSAFEDDPGVRPSFRQHVASAAAWEPIPADGLERYEQGRPR